jgi:hypothetical protein
METARTGAAGGGFVGPGAYTVTAEDVFVRSHPMGLVTGTLQQGDTFYASEVHGEWAWGHAYGHVDQPGWMLIRNHQEGDGDRTYATRVRTAAESYEPRAARTGPRLLHHDRDLHYIRSARDMDGAWNYSFPGLVRDGGIQLYSNYSTEHGARDPALRMPADTEIGVRYLVDDEWAMLQVKSTTTPDGRARWLFGRVDALDLHDPTVAMRMLRDGDEPARGYDTSTAGNRRERIDAIRSSSPIHP